MGTSTKIYFGLLDVTAREDSTPICADKQDFVSLSDLKSEVPLSPPKSATLEDSFFLLDGSFSPFPDAPSGAGWGLWSASMSGSDGSFSTPPVLEVSFTEPHSSIGLTLTFSPDTNDYANSVLAVWYDGSENIIAQKAFAPDGAQYYVEKKVEGYRKVTLTFYSTAKPYRYLKLQNIEYGLVSMELSGESIVSASILEEMDPTSAELTVNTLDLQVYSKDSRFSLLNPQGVFSVLQQRQRLAVSEIVNGVEIPMGTYYLDAWKNADDYSVDLSAVDLIGIIDQTNFSGGMYNNVAASDIVASIMTSADVPYSLDASLENKTLSGYLPICTHREALQQVAFALGAVVDCSRGDEIRICSPPSRPTSHISKSRKFSGGTVELRSLVTGIDVVAHKYQPNTESRELFSDTLEAGDYQIVFTDPAHNLSISGGTILSSTVNQAVIRVSAAGKVALTGQGYTDTRRIVSKRMLDLPANTTSNVLQVDDATLVTGDNADAIAQRLYDYYQLRYNNEFKLLTSSERVGDWVVVDSLRDERLKGTIESMEIDLTGGVITSARVVGARIPTITGYQLGELISGEEMGAL